MPEKNIHARPFREKELNSDGTWTMDAELGLLKDNIGTETRLEPRLAKLMSVLLSNPDQFVSRRVLIDEMWPDSVVTEQSLTRAVADLRKFLRSNYASPPIIETASKQGYRLICPTESDATESASKPQWNTLQIIAYGFAALVLLVLVVRGLSY